jgi:rhamnosyltransferase
VRFPVIASVITYYPTQETVDNILSYYDYVDEILIIDNTDSQPENFYNNFSGWAKLTVISNGQNLGLGTALNIAAREAVKRGYEWMLTMDQDSAFEPAQISNYLHCVACLNSTSSGVFGVNYTASQHTKIAGDCSSQDEDCVITSGSIINLKGWDKIGGFNELLFIDGVDDEFCFKIKLAGLSVLKLDNVWLNHKLGKDVLVRNWYIGPKVYRNIHPPIRLYYMVRNYLHLIRLYHKDFPEKSAEYRRTLRNKIKNNFLYNKKRYLVLKYIVRGYLDFRKGKLGKLTADYN